MKFIDNGMLEVNTKNILVTAIVGGAVAGAVYICYKHWKKHVKEVDEGFSDEKGSGEPLPKRVLVLGLDGSGKSCLLQALSSEKDFTGETQPTDGFNIVSVSNNRDRDLDIWEIGGMESVRRYWPNFIQDTDILIYVIDSADRKRFPDSYTEMHKLLGEERLLEKPFLVVANKQDLANAANTAEIKEALGLEDVKHHRVQIVPTSLRPSPLPMVGIDQVREMLINL